MPGNVEEPADGLLGDLEIEISGSFGQRFTALKRSKHRISPKPASCSIEQVSRLTVTTEAKVDSDSGKPKEECPQDPS